jgi:ankyrin repeat protein
MHMAAQNGNLDVVRVLGEFGANVNQAMQDGATPLYIAAEIGHLAACGAIFGRRARS